MNITTEHTQYHTADEELAGQNVNAPTEEEIARRKARVKYLKNHYDFSNNDPKFYPMDIELESYIQDLENRPPMTRDWLCVFTPDTAADKKHIAAGAEYVSLIRAHSPEKFTLGIHADEETAQRFVWLEAMNFNYKTYSFSMGYPAGRRNRLFAGVYIYKKYADVADITCNVGEYKTRWEFFGEYKELKDNKYTMEYLRITGVDLYISGYYNGYSHVDLYVTPRRIESNLNHDEFTYSSDEKTETFYYRYYVHGINFSVWKDEKGVWARLYSSCNDAPREFTRLYDGTHTTTPEIEMFEFLMMPKFLWFNREIIANYIQRQIETAKTCKKLIE